MDGQKVPLSKVEDIKQALEPYTQKYGHYLTKMRPWREFFHFTKPDGDVKARLEANLSHFQINYALLFVSLMVTSIVMDPHSVIVICVLALLWMWFLKKNDDPNWEVVVGGIPLGKTHRWMALCGISMLAFLVTAGNLIFSTCFFCAILVVAHGSLHPVPEVLTEGWAATDVI